MNNDFNTTLAAMSIEDKVALLTGSAAAARYRRYHYDRRYLWRSLQQRAD